MLESLPENLFFHQAIDEDTKTYTYFLADLSTREAVIIDSVLDNLERDLDLLRNHGLHLKILLETHTHADHASGAGRLRALTNAKIAMSRAACHSGVVGVDLGLDDSDEIYFGQYSLRAISTPGHTSGCMSFFCEGLLFTGDTLLIGSVGRCDLQGGCSQTLYKSLVEKLFSLPGETLIFPAHDYKGQSYSTIAQEKVNNLKIAGKSPHEFSEIMGSQKLDRPRKLDEAMSINLDWTR